MTEPATTYAGHPVVSCMHAHAGTIYTACPRLVHGLSAEPCPSCPAGSPDGTDAMALYKGLDDLASVIVARQRSLDVARSALDGRWAIQDTAYAAARELLTEAQDAVTGARRRLAEILPPEARDDDE